MYSTCTYKANYKFQNKNKIHFLGYHRDRGLLPEGRSTRPKLNIYIQVLRSVVNCGGSGLEVIDVDLFPSVYNCILSTGLQ